MNILKEPLELLVEWVCAIQSNQLQSSWILINYVQIWFKQIWFI